MRRPIVLCLVACAAAAAALALGSALGAQTDDAAPAGHAAHLTAARFPLAGLDARFRKLAPAGACAAGAPKARPARRLRAAALKGAAKAPPKVLRRKKASMRRAIGLMRAAGDLCEAAQGGGAPARRTGRRRRRGRRPGPRRRRRSPSTSPGPTRCASRHRRPPRAGADAADHREHVGPVPLRRRAPRAGQPGHHRDAPGRSRPRPSPWTSNIGAGHVRDLLPPGRPRAMGMHIPFTVG